MAGSALFTRRPHPSRRCPSSCRRAEIEGRIGQAAPHGQTKPANPRPETRRAWRQVPVWCRMPPKPNTNLSVTSVTRIEVKNTPRWVARKGLLGGIAQGRRRAEEKPDAKQQGRQARPRHQRETEECHAAQVQNREHGARCRNHPAARAGTTVALPLAGSQRSCHMLR